MKRMTRHALHTLLGACALMRLAAGAIAAPATDANFQGLWWRTSGSESGWGLNITHQADTLFVTWFTYDLDGSGLWLVMSDGAKTGPGTYGGTLYRTTGPSFDATPWNPGAVTITQVGTATFTFSGADHGTFSYSVDGIAGSKAIARMAYAAPPTVCR